MSEKDISRNMILKSNNSPPVSPLLAETTVHAPHSPISSTKSPLPRLGFLASHNGSSMQAIIKGISEGIIPAIPQVIISNNYDSMALQFAMKHKIESAHISRKTLGSDEAVDEALTAVFTACDWIILSGYMRPIGPKMLNKFPQKMFNIHPSLLPAFSGPGMYGRKIHEAVIAAGVNYTGITIHRVAEGYDTGEIVAQIPISVSIDETVDSLEEKVKNQEPAFFAQYIREISINFAENIKDV